jgi:Fe-S cluster assembly protein SufB
MDTEISKVFEDIEVWKNKQWFESKYIPKVLLKGKLSEEVVRKISEIKDEPEWMLNIRLKAMEAFNKIPLPDWGPDLTEINFDEISYYTSPVLYPKPSTWEALPESFKEVYRKLGLSREYVEKYLGGALFQHDSAPIFREVNKYLEEKGVIFLSLDEAVREYPEIVKKYFGRAVSMWENKFAALNTAVWSGGVFIYVPENTKVEIPLHAYFRINMDKIGQFERTLIVCEKNSEVTYVEGCTAPIYSLGSLHAAVVETFVGKNAKLTYVTLQNWSKNVYNLVTKRAIGEEDSQINWISFEIGSKKTMLYPSLILKDRAKGKIYTVSIPSDGQIIDSGGRLFMLGKDSKAEIVSKGISIGLKDFSKVVNRTDVRIFEGAKNAYVKSSCEALIIGKGFSESIPRFIIEEKDAHYNHEAKMDIIDKERLLYLKSKGISEKNAIKMLVFGFLADIENEVPSFFMIEMRKLLEIELEEYGGFG